MVAAIIALFAPAARAAAPAEEPDSNDLEALLDESVVTTTSRSAERASVAPATIFSITAAEMFLSGARTVDEALELLGLGVYVARPRDYNTGIDVGAQGLLFRDAGRHVLVMLDGVILNAQGTGRISIHEALGVPIDLIDHVEVMLGPGSVMYGSNAMLAVINVVTKRARDLPTVHASFELGTAAPQDPDGDLSAAGGARLGLRYRLSLGGGARFQLFGKAGEVSAMAEWLHEESASYGVVPFAQGAPANQSFLPGQPTWGGLASHVMIAPSAVLNLRLGAVRLLVSAHHYVREMPLVGTFMDPYAREQQTALRLDLAHTWQLSSRLTLDSRIYAGYAAMAERSNYGESFWCPDGLSQCHFELSARSGWLGLEQKLSADWFVDGRLLTSVGYDLRPRFFDGTPADYTDYFTGAPPPGLELPRSKDTSFLGALFAQQIWRPLGWFALNVGARLDIANPFGVKFSPRAALVFTPGRTTLRASYSEAFRAPSAYELTEFDPTYRLSPATLLPETVRSVELEVQQRVWRLTLAARGYASFYQDLIESRVATAEEVQAAAARLSSTIDPSVVVVNDNLTSLRVFGGSAQAQLRLPRQLFLAATFNLARALTEDGAVYDRMPFWFGNFRVGWQGADDGPAVMLSGVYSSDRLILMNANPTEFRLGPRLDLRLSGSVPIPGAPGLTMRAALSWKLNPFLPYAVTTETDTPLTYVLYPDQPRLFGFIGFHYDHRGCC